MRYMFIYLEIGDSEKFLCHLMKNIQSHNYIRSIIIYWEIGNSQKFHSVS